jgi:FMN phosphatase YigB (HAD superfamily)
MDLRRNLSRELEVALFDLGGVLVCDPWQSLLLTPERGLADRFNLDRTTVEMVGESLWLHYSSQEETEGHYWRDVAWKLGIKITPELVRDLESELLYVNPAATTILETLRNVGVRLGVVSDNTSFWYRKQAELIALERYLDPDLVFLSYLFGVHKHAGRGANLFDVASHRLDPRVTLVIDDRADNLRRAHEYRFQVMKYSMDEESSLLTRMAQGGYL